MKYNYPQIRKSELVEEHFGHQLPAPYTWLRNTDDPEVKDFTARENTFTDQYFNKEEVNAMIEKLKAEKNPDLPLYISPWHDGYIASEDNDGNFTINKLDANLNKTKTLFKRYDLPERTPFYASPCPVDEDLLGIMAQVDNAPRPDIIVYDFRKGEILKILPMTFSGVWSKKKAVIYVPTTKTDGNKSQTVIQKWDRDTNEVSDVFAYEGNAIFGETKISEDGRSLIFSFSVNYSEDFFYIYNEEDESIYPLNPDKAMKLKYIDSINGKHYFVSLEENPHGDVIAINDKDDISKAQLIRSEKEAYIDSGFTVNEKIFLLGSKDGASKLISLDEDKEIELPEKVVSLSLNGKTAKGKVFSYDSFTSSPKLLEFDGETFKTLCGKDEDSSDLTVELLYGISIDDKTPIPYYLVRQKDAENDKSHKTLIYGYGGYNAPMPPWSTEMVSQTNIAAWVRSGGIYVHCLLRGGSEYGTRWHEEGMGMKKKNCYYDFIGIAESVIEKGWTVPEKIAISGCSNGGLLMSTLVTMRSDLWGCVIDSVPHTDMIHFAKDDRGPMYITEYGDPYNSKEEFEYLLSYSPVHNVKDVEYPAVYIQTGECDNNVPPYHGKSFAATMQEHNKSDNPILLRVLALGSHDRGQGEVFWQTIAEMHVFMEKNLK
ncbi:MAG: S9 family peptidase [Erysipelotrichaceae bacterium]|nr:S9 family peptidase [Erysipelotrichaceae bacterium]